jgi:hypothetical protein
MQKYSEIKIKNGLKNNQTGDSISESYNSNLPLVDE